MHDINRDGKHDHHDTTLRDEILKGSGRQRQQPARKGRRSLGQLSTGEWLVVGIVFLRYQEEMVDCGRSARSASSYSDQPRSSRYALMTERMSFTMPTPYRQ